jgi:hypothetical protein
MTVENTQSDPPKIDDKQEEKKDENFTKVDQKFGLWTLDLKRFLVFFFFFFFFKHLDWKNQTLGFQF